MLGVVFLYAAYTKLRHPWLLFALSIDSYQLIPAWAVLALARTLPWLELAMGLLLISGWHLRHVSIVSTLMLAGFFSVMLVQYWVGNTIDCGCFGVGEALSARTLARDGVLLTIGLALVALSHRKRASETASPLQP
jgi:uncharacterized membrane protein YphA (DoxX/SURF4 family)